MTRRIKVFLKQFLTPKFRYLNKFNIRKGDIVIDLGANVGEVMEYFLNKGAIVHGYEPNEHAFSVLQQRVGKKNGAHLYQAGVSNFAGKSKLYLHKSHNESEVNFSQAGSLCADKSNVGDDYLEVDIEDIATVLDAHNHIRLLKIDIEGGEYDIADAILERSNKIDYILLETHGNKNPEFAIKETELMDKIAKSPHKSKFYTDWF